MGFAVRTDLESAAEVINHDAEHGRGEIRNTFVYYASNNPAG